MQSKRITLSVVAMQQRSGSSHWYGLIFIICVRAEQGPGWDRVEAQLPTIRQFLPHLGSSSCPEILLYQELHMAPCVAAYVSSMPVHSYNCIQTVNVADKLP